MVDIATISNIHSNKDTKIQDLHKENHKIVMERHKARTEQLERYSMC